MVLMRELEWMVTDCRADVRAVLANENSEVMYKEDSQGGGADLRPLNFI
jgi:hypothetical protein